MIVTAADEHTKDAGLPHLSKGDLLLALHGTLERHGNALANSQSLAAGNARRTIAPAGSRRRVHAAKIGEGSPTRSSVKAKSPLVRQ